MVARAHPDPTGLHEYLWAVRLSMSRADDAVYMYLGWESRKATSARLWNMAADLNLAVGGARCTMGGLIISRSEATDSLMRAVCTVENAIDRTDDIFVCGIYYDLVMRVTGRRRDHTAGLWICACNLWVRTSNACDDDGTAWNTIDFM